jgi:hypothetical protein
VSVLCVVLSGGNGQVAGHLLVRAVIGWGKIDVGGEGFSWFGCPASEESVWRNAWKGSVINVVGLPPAEPVRRCSAEGEGSVRGLCCLPDASGGEEASAVVSELCCLSFLPC